MDLLLSTIISCSDGKWILDGIASSNVSNRQKNELTIEIIQSMPDGCRGRQYRGESTR